MATLAEPEDRGAAFGFLCADLAAWAATRKARLGRRRDHLRRRVLAPSAMGPGMPSTWPSGSGTSASGVVFLAQSWEGFGPPELRERLLAACAALVVLGMDRPEPLLAAAGSVQVARAELAARPPWPDRAGPAAAWSSGPPVDPNAVRRAEVGECWVVSGGRYLHGQVRPALGAAVAGAGPAGGGGGRRGRAGVDHHAGSPGRAVERRERPLAVPGAEPPALPAPRLALVARQLAARVQSGELELAGELADRVRPGGGAGRDGRGPAAPTGPRWPSCYVALVRWRP